MKFDQLNIRILLATRRYMLYTVGLGLAAFVLVVSVLIPQIQATLETVAKLQTETPKTEQLRKKVVALDSITSTAEYAQIEIVDRAFPSNKPLMELLLSLSTVSQRTGAVLQKFSLAPGLVASDAATLQATSQSSADYDKIDVEMEVVGTFEQLQQFLLQVEQISPFTTVVLMDITGELSEVQQQNPLLPFRAKLLTETYFFTQPVSVRIEAPLPVISQAQQTVLGALMSFARVDLPTQTEVRDGGLEDLFSRASDSTREELEALLGVSRLGQSTAASGSALPTAPQETLQ